MLRLWPAKYSNYNTNFGEHVFLPYRKCLSSRVSPGEELVILDRQRNFRSVLILQLFLAHAPVVRPFTDFSKLTLGHTDCLSKLPEVNGK